MNKKLVFKLISFSLKMGKVQFNLIEIEDFRDLLNSEILKICNNQVEINIHSVLFNEILLEYVEDIQDQKLPQNIPKAFDYIDQFEKQKKEEFGYSNIINAYSELINGVKAYVFYLFHQKGILNFYDFIKSLKKNDLYDYEEYLLPTIIMIDIQEVALYEILSLLKSSETNSYRIPTICMKLAKNKPELAYRLYDYTITKNDKNDFYILSNLLIGSFENDEEQSFQKAINHLKINPSIAYFVLGRFNYTNEKYISECFKIAGNANIVDIDSLLQVPYIYRTLIENPKTSQEIRKKCFSKMQELFLIENEQIKNDIFFNCRIINGNEEERYKLLIETFLSKSQSYYNQIGSFFHNFINPDYFFYLFSTLYGIHYQNRGSLMDVHVFSEALSHFWNTNKNKTEEHLLNLLSHDSPYLRIGAVHLIQSKHLGFYPVNVLSLNSEIKQLRALEALLFNCFYNIDAYLPSILLFKSSSYEKVVTYLQSKLSKLIMESYLDYLYEKIAKYVDDEIFLIPLKESLDLYHKLKEKKTTINDLNPRQNEHDLMNLYYTLEREEQQKMMRNANKENNSFLSMVKETIIVRGNSWKIAGNEVSPLGHIEHSVTLDLNMYKNPDLFDYTHHTFNSEF